MKSKITRLAMMVCLVLSASTSLAFSEGRFAVGALGGHVGLTNDPGDLGGNGLGAGVAVEFFSQDDIGLVLNYLKSNHDNLDHTETSLGADIYLADINAGIPFLSGGAVFATNDITSTTFTGSSDAFGLYVGGGIDFGLGENVRLGLQARYNYIFDAEETVGTTPLTAKETTVADNATVLARLVFAFGEDSWW